jgi:putative FmdB family regulatory protein
MPKYDFHCETCGKEFSESLPMGTLTLPSCPTCRNAKAVRKLIRAPIVHFKGSGFYKTDSSGGAKTKPKETTQPPPAETKTETKPAETKAPEVKPTEKKAEPKK